MGEVNGQVTNRQLYEALMEIHQTMAAIQVAQAGLPCHEHAHALDSYDNKLRDIKLDYKAADCRITAEMNRRQIFWAGGGAGAILAVIAGWLGFKG